MTLPMTPPIDPAAVALRIRSLCDLHGGLTGLARKCSIAVPTLEGVLSGKSLPSVMTLASVCKGSGCSADWILFGEAWS